MIEKTQSIPARLKNIAKGGHVAGTEDIIDDVSGKTQKEINEDIDDSLNQLSDEIDAVNKQDIIPVDTLPSIADADSKKIYRVVGEDSYTDYMVNASGDNWKTLATYSFPGIDDEPTAGSDNLVKSGGVVRYVRKANQGFTIEYNHTMSISSSLNVWRYTISDSFDLLIIFLTCKTKQIIMHGLVSPSEYRFANSPNIFTGENEYSKYIGHSDTGIVPDGAVVCTIALDKSLYPNGYNEFYLETIEDDIPIDGSNSTVKSSGIAQSIRNANKGFVIGYNHTMNIIVDSEVWQYVSSDVYDLLIIHIPYNAKQLIVHGLSQGKYRYANSPNIFTGENVFEHYLTYNSTGVIPDSAVLCTIALDKSLYPNGYDDLYLEIIDNVDDKIRNANISIDKGFFIDNNKILNIVSSSVGPITYQDNENFDCIVTYPQGAKTIKINGLLASANYRFFDTADIFNGENVFSHLIGTNKTGDVPEGAVLCINSLRKTDYPEGYDEFNLERVYKDSQVPSIKKTIRILLIGNSATDDALSYVPFIMQNMGVDVDFQIGIAMMSSSTLAMHLDNFENETAAYSFRLYTKGTSWQNYPNKTIQWMLDNYQWDIVSLQQAQPQKADTYQPYLNKLINLISNYIDYPIKFIWYQTHIYSASKNGDVPRSEETITQYYEAEATASHDVLDDTICEYVVPVSTAIQNARSILTIKTIGDYANNPNNETGFGYLNYSDGVHLQEGLPCQIAAYTFILSILDIYGFEEYSINGETTRVTTEWTSGKNIPSPHGSPVGSTQENCLIAQKCAIMALRHPFKVTDMNYIVNPT